MKSKMEKYLAEFDTYLKETGHTALTTFGYLGDVRLFLNWYTARFGEPASFAAFTETNIRDYKNSMAALHPGTVYRRMAALAAFCHWGRQAGYLDLPYNPVGLVKTDKITPPVIHWLTPEAKTQFLTVLERLTEQALLQTPHYKFLALRDLAMVKLLLATGLKPVEVVALSLEVVSLRPSEERVCLASTPNAPGREFLLPPYCHQGLRTYLDIRPSLSNPHVFIGPRGQMVSEKTVRRALLRFAQEPDLPEVSAQILRHTFTKNLLNRGFPPEQIAALLGHTDVNLTRRYLALFEKSPN